MFHGKMKAITFSYDDGVVQDRRLIELLDKYGLKATFNLNSEWFGKQHVFQTNGKDFEHIKIEQHEVRELYKNHEVAVHTLTHPKLPSLPDEEVIRQVEQDRLNLSRIVGYEVIGMAYPGGGVNHDDRTAKLIREHTGVQYARTIECNGSFELEQDIFKFKPSAHHLEPNGKTYKLCKRFVEMKTDKPKLLYIWGHSYEMDFGDRWDELEEIFKLISGRNDIFYGTNRDVFECCLFNNILPLPILQHDRKSCKIYWTCIKKYLYHIKEGKRMLKNHKLFLFDMDGTLYLGDQLYPFTKELLSTIKEKGKRYLFMTNNSSKSVQDYVKKLAKLGIEATEEDFITSSQATAYYLKLHHAGARLYVCGTNSLKEELRKNGFVVTENIEEVDVIVMGFDTELTFKKLEDVSKMLLTRELPYIATNPDYVCPTEFGSVPDCGSVCDMIYNATKKRPLVIGKPEALMPELAMQQHGYKKEETVVIGDRIYTDIKSGLNAGITTILVMSGETTQEILDASEDKPHFVMQDASEMIPVL